MPVLLGLRMLPRLSFQAVFAGAFGGFPIKGKPQSSTALWLWGQSFLTNPLISPPQLLSPFSNRQQHKEEQTSKSSLWDISLLAFRVPWEHARSLLGQRGRVRINEDNLSQARSWTSYFHFPSPGAVAQRPCCTEGTMSDCHPTTRDLGSSHGARRHPQAELLAVCALQVPSVGWGAPSLQDTRLSAP